MKVRIAHVATLALGLAVLAGCSGGGLEDIAPKATRQLPEKVQTAMKAKGMHKNAPIMMRLFKEESKLEVWKQKANGRYEMISSYDICKWSGQLGPKFIEGDRQAPEGFYSIAPAQMNPNSQYHLSFNIGFPNAYDRANGRTGQHLMVHGACSSSGCYSMSDEHVEEIYAFARDSFAGGQTAFQLQAFPFRMTPQNMARYKDDENYSFWTMIKEGYDHFELTKVPPKVDVCGRNYVFNRLPASGQSFRSTEACPASSMPDTLTASYKALQAQEKAVFDQAVARANGKTPMDSILGPKEAKLVADWSTRRARGEQVSSAPPVLQSAPLLALAATRKPAEPEIAPVEVAAPVTAPAPTAVAATPPSAPAIAYSGITPTSSDVSGTVAQAPTAEKPAGNRLTRLFSRISGL